MSTSIAKYKLAIRDRAEKWTSSDILNYDDASELIAAAEDYARTYQGTFEFMTSMREAVQKNGMLTVRQIAGVLNCMRSEFRREAMQSTQEANAPVESLVPEGTFTVCFNSEGTDYVTLRVVKCTYPDLPKGTQIVQYLAGPDNETNYAGFAFLVGDKIRLWSRFKSDSRLIEALELLLVDPKECGHMYALQSGRCWRCNQKLTVPASIHRGLGPICAEMIGA